MLIPVIICLLLVFIYFSEFNTFRVNGYNVKNYDSVKLLEEINTRIKKLQEFMLKKYSVNRYVNGYNMYERTVQLIENYNHENIHEISPFNLLGNTSFTQYKKKMVFCLRDKNGKLHDINTVMFVVLHEITHLMNDRWGHETYFWGLFHIILIDSVQCGIYNPINYNVNPQSYCGIKITENPYYISI